MFDNALLKLLNPPFVTHPTQIIRWRTDLARCYLQAFTEQRRGHPVAAIFVWRPQAARHTDLREVDNTSDRPGLGQRGGKPVRAPDALVVSWEPIGAFPVHMSTAQCTEYLRGGGAVSCPRRLARVWRHCFAHSGEEVQTVARGGLPPHIPRSLPMRMSHRIAGDAPRSSRTGASSLSTCVLQ